MSLQWMITRRASSFGKLGVKGVFVFCSRGKQRVERGLEIGECIVWGEEVNGSGFVVLYLLVWLDGRRNRLLVSVTVELC